jgi:hypothetical protein
MTEDIKDIMDTKDTKDTMNTKNTKNTKKKHYYQDLEDRFAEVWKSAISTYKLNQRINMIVVGIGIGLIVYGLVFQWLDNFYALPTASPKNATNNEAKVTTANSNTTDGQASVVASVMGTNSDTTDDQANGTSANSNSENEPNIPNYSGLVSSTTGLATIVGLFFFRTQAHIQRAFTNLALTNFISTANLWGFKRLDWYMWERYKVPTLKEDDPERLQAGKFEKVQNIDFDAYAKVLDKMQELTKEYSAQLYKKTRLMEDPTEQEKKEIKKDDNTSSDKGENAGKTDTTTDEKNQKP